MLQPLTGLQADLRGRCFGNSGGDYMTNTVCEASNEKGSGRLCGQVGLIPARDLDVGVTGGSLRPTPRPVSAGLVNKRERLAVTSGGADARMPRERQQRRAQGTQRAHTHMHGPL
ncbi:hypothetical protein Bbelb_429300 [Branchiostoma belcheri]|nr:hypothetical protein Bbelb_429300 [Branchiostoma belcheri]